MQLQFIFFAAIYIVSKWTEFSGHWFISMFVDVTFPISLIDADQQFNKHFKEELSPAIRNDTHLSESENSKTVLSFLSEDSSEPINSRIFQDKDKKTKEEKEAEKKKKEEEKEEKKKKKEEEKKKKKEEKEKKKQEKKNSTIY